MSAVPRLPPWTRDPVRVENALKRRGRAGQTAREFWHALLLMAFDLDDLVRALVDGDAGRTGALVRQLDLAVREVVPALPIPSAPPRLARRLLLAALTEEDSSDTRFALADTLSEDAAILAALVEAPVARDDGALRRDAADVLAALAPLLSTWAEREPIVQPVVTLAPEPETPRPLPEDDRY